MPVVHGDNVPVGAFETSLGHELGHILLRRREHAAGGLMQQNGPYPATLSPEEVCMAQRYFVP
jgi:hypothetical protein